MSKPKFSIEPFIAQPGETFDLSRFDPGWRDDAELEKFGVEKLHEDAKKILKKRRRELAEAQERLYADN
ncbi:MAG: hypothetical protein AAFQ42_14185, partial [Pseudomonadota bacterium]